MKSPVGKNMKEEKEERRGNNKIRVGSIVIVKSGEMKYKARVSRSRWLREETLGCFQSVLGKKISELVLSMGKINI